MQSLLVLYLHQYHIVTQLFSLLNTMVHRSIGVVLIEDMHVKYIHSNAVLFLKIIINFVQPILPYWMSSLLVVQWTNGK